MGWVGAGRAIRTEWALANGARVATQIPPMLRSRAISSNRVGYAFQLDCDRELGGDSLRPPALAPPEAVERRDTQSFLRGPSEPALGIETHLEVPGSHDGGHWADPLRYRSGTPSHEAGSSATSGSDMGLISHWTGSSGAKPIAGHPKGTGSLSHGQNGPQERVVSQLRGFSGSRSKWVPAQNPAKRREFPC